MNTLTIKKPTICIASQVHVIKFQDACISISFKLRSERYSKQIFIHGVYYLIDDFKFIKKTFDVTFKFEKYKTYKNKGIHLVFVSVVTIPQNFPPASVVFCRYFPTISSRWHVVVTTGFVGMLPSDTASNSTWVFNGGSPRCSMLWVIVDISTSDVSLDRRH